MCDAVTHPPGMMGAMTSNPIRHITVDAHEPLKVAQFWVHVTGYRIDDESDNEEALLESPFEQSPGLLFIAVPEGKTVKNRVHLDVRVGREQIEAEVARLVALGARELHRGSQGPSTWVTLADPEGNELCIS